MRLMRPQTTRTAIRLRAAAALASCFVWPLAPESKATHRERTRAAATSH